LSEDQIDVVLSAINHSLRRHIVQHLAESGPQSYTALLEKFKLQTGTLNHHLGVLKDLLEQDEQKRYTLNRNGRIACQILTYTRASFTKPVLPVVKRRMIAPALRHSVLGLYKLAFHPAKAFVEAQERLGPYAICGAIVVTLFLASTPLLSADAIVRSLTGLLYVLFFSFIFARLVYRKNPRLSRLTVSISMSYLPLVLLNLLTILFAAIEFVAWTPASLIIVEDPRYIAITQIFAATLIWRFILLFLAVRESSRLSNSQSFTTVFVSTLLENAVAIALDYIFAIPITFL